MTPRRPRFSRWRRLPGAYRISERKPPNPYEELERLTLYLPGRLLDRAEQLAKHAGAPSVQAYCEALLRDAIERAHELLRLHESEARRATLEGLDAIASDPDYLAEWNASSPRPAIAFLSENDSPMNGPDPSPGRETEANSAPSFEAREYRLLPSPLASAIETVLRHAALLSDDPSALLPTLRRAEPIRAEAASELLQALVTLEQGFRHENRIERRLSYALHRIAFEGQVLLTDAWPQMPVDAATVETMRMIQEAVDRVLSGEDIRYYAAEPTDENSASRLDVEERDHADRAEYDE